MADPVQYLSDWIQRYLKNRDLVFRKIADIEQKGDMFLVKEKRGKEMTYYVEAFISEPAALLKRVGKDKPVGVVLYNTKENFDFVKKNWKQLVEIKSLAFYFVNPFSKIDKRWVLFPRTHALIADETSLDLGLQTMFDTVEPITEEEVKRVLVQ